MSKRKRIFSSKIFNEWIKEGRGKGEGPSYKPWYRIQDVSSLGTCHRIKSVWTTGRETHLLSNLERDWFFVFDWASHVVDIREQFPLLPLAETQAIAAECGISHPFERRSPEKQAIVLTSDFRITVVEGDRTVDQIRTVKYAESLSNKRVMEKFEIERRYWERRSIAWGIVTERELPKELIRNIELLRGRCCLSERLNLRAEQLYLIAQSLTKAITSEHLSLKEAGTNCEHQFGLDKGAGLTIAYYLLANRYWKVDMYSPIDARKEMTLLDHDFEKLQPTGRRS